MAEPREPVLTYQDTVVLRASVTRTPGTDPDSAEIEMTSRAFGQLRFERPGSLYDDVGVTSAVQGPGRLDTIKLDLQGSLRIRGDLVLFDGERSVTFANLYVRDDGIEVARFVDDEDGDTVVNLTLVDVRYFWNRRGELWGTYNVLRPDGSYDPTTVKPSGAPYPLRTILEKILAALPGRPRIERAPPSLGTVVPPNLEWRGTRPKEELDRLLQTYRLTFGLTLDNHVVLTDESESAPADTRSGAAREVGGAKLPEGQWKRLRRRAFRHRPQAVRVLGPRVVREVTIEDLEPVGFALGPDDSANERVYRSWEEAAASYGLSLADLASFVLLSDKDKGALMEKLVGGDARARVAEIDRWAFRMFRIPRRFRGFLPILAERAESLLAAAEGTPGATGATGASSSDADPSEPRRRTPPKVEAETYEEIREVPSSGKSTLRLPVAGSTNDPGVRISTEEALLRGRLRGGGS